MIPTWLSRYTERGFRLIYWPRGKDPATWKGPREAGWNERTYSPDDYNEGCNVGVLLGTEIQPGKFLCDVDFDWTDGLPLARTVLPPTEFGFGRPSRDTSHAFFTTSKPVVSKVYEDIDNKGFVEIRGTKNDGTIGFQTMMPPSLHPNGETLRMKVDGEIGHSDEIERRVMLYAIACMLWQHLGLKGLHHNNRLSVAGFLLTEGLAENEVILINTAVAQMSGNDVSDVETTTRTTAALLRGGNAAVQGKGALIKAIGGEKDKEGKKVVARIREWLGGTDFLHDDKDKTFKDNQENIRRALVKLDAVLSFNTFAQAPIVQYNGYTGRLEDHMQDQIWLDIDAKFQFRPTKEFFQTVVGSIARHNTFHPVLDYLSSLKWDGIPRIDEWLIKYAGAADSEYARSVSSMVLMAAVKRVRQPGCKFDEITILESGQGLLKSSALKSLCYREEWFTDDLPLNVDSKIVIERTAGKWIIEASDLSGMKAAQQEHLKALLSRQVDAARLSYGRLLSEVPRQWIIIGTTNHQVYLKDATGGRRFWPMRIKQFDLDGLKSVRDQLWAEAAARESSGESIRLSPHLYKFAELQQERRREEDPWEEVIRKHFDEHKRMRITVNELWDLVHVPVERRSNVDQKRLSDIMTQMMFKRGHVRPFAGGDAARGWKRDGDPDLFTRKDED